MSTMRPTAKNTEQNALSTAAEVILIARPTRHRAVIKNIDAAITIYVGEDSGVTSANGMEVKFGESVEVRGTGEWYGIAASGTPSIAIIDEF